QRRPATEVVVAREVRCRGASTERPPTATCDAPPSSRAAASSPGFYGEAANGDLRRKCGVQAGRRERASTERPPTATCDLASGSPTPFPKQLLRRGRQRRPATPRPVCASGCRSASTERPPTATCDARRRTRVSGRRRCGL